MARIVFTNTASNDQANLLEYLGEKAGLRTAVKFQSRFRALFDRLTDHPASGPRRPALGADVRIGVITPYIVIYRYDEANDTVTVMRVVHGRRDIKKTLTTSTN
jgi:toxin ParE1/3/4